MPIEESLISLSKRSSTHIEENLLCAFGFSKENICINIRYYYRISVRTVIRRQLGCASRSVGRRTFRTRPKIFVFAQLIDIRSISYMVSQTTFNERLEFSNYQTMSRFLIRSIYFGSIRHQRFGRKFDFLGF